ncbi:MAG: tetratricopeptide repeat protein [Spirochaetota bacterium]|nr:tetratricopeptide repeat protein [Spirochaetota bacterium]
MKIQLFILIMLLFTMNTISLLAEEGEAPTGLRRVSDDLKFKNAMLLFKIGKREKAFEKFKEYLEIYINGIHRREAYQRIAQIYFNRFEFLQAIGIYKALYSEFSTFESGIDAYYRMGICYRKMGYDKKANSIFKSIIKEYPNSKYLNLSKMQLDIMKMVNEDI